MGDFVITEDGAVYWPRCPVEGCPNRICLSLNSDKCYPHTFGLPHNFMSGPAEEGVEHLIMHLTKGHQWIAILPVTGWR